MNRVTLLLSHEALPVYRHCRAGSKDTLRPVTRSRSTWLEVIPGALGRFGPSDGGVDRSHHAGGHSNDLGPAPANMADFADFEMGERDVLLEQYPQYEEIIRRLTRE